MKDGYLGSPDMFKPFILGDWHAWQGEGGILLSDESCKRIHSFDTPDSAITWLYMNGHKEAARAMNRHTKES
jgi:hypothetical protein